MSRAIWSGEFEVAERGFGLLDGMSEAREPLLDSTKLAVEEGGRISVSTGVWGGPVAISVAIDEAHKAGQSRTKSSTFRLICRPACW